MLLNGKRDFIIDLTYDGCFYKELTTVIPTYSATRRTIRELIKMGYKFDDLAVRCVKTNRYVSWCQ